MRNAETVLDIIRNRGKRHLPLDDLYRQLYNPELYLAAYAKLYRNDGALTTGSTEETVDGMSMGKIRAIIEKLRQERYRFQPVRRTEIPKKDGKKRPLGIPTWSDKLVQEVLRMILEAYYEPQFSEHSHGFRRHRGCHTALEHIKMVWHGTKWFIEGDIRSCFDRIDHSILMKLLRNRIQDNRFLRLIQHLLEAGYLQDWKYTPTLSGTPQGGIVSPILANIYLHELDEYVEKELIPKYTQGKRRRHSPAYDHACNQAYYCRRTGRIEEARTFEKLRRQLPSNDPYDPTYRRLRYVRYADDFLLGFVGTKEEAESIKAALGKFLGDQLRLELSQEKTLITHAATETARFLGYQVSVSQCSTKITANRRSINGGIALRVPETFTDDRCRFYMRNGKPIHRMERTHETDYSIVCRYQSEYRGYVQYYQLAENLIWLNKIHWVMQTSLLKTLAHKHKTRVPKICARYASKVQTPEGWRKCIEVKVPREGKTPLVARFGGIVLKYRRKATIQDDYLARKKMGRTELLQRLLADTCEVCTATDNIEVHHIRKMADVHENGRKRKPDWMVLMASRRRKTLVLCRKCHDDLHAGRPLQAHAA